MSQSSTQHVLLCQVSASMRCQFRFRAVDSFPDLRPAGPVEASCITFVGLGNMSSGDVCGLSSNLTGNMASDGKQAWRANFHFLVLLCSLSFVGVFGRLGSYGLAFDSGAPEGSAHGNGGSSATDAIWAS